MSEQAQEPFVRGALADQVHNAPPPVSLLDVLDRKDGHFRPAQSAAEQHGDDGAVA
jgi:hypothetical protein